MNTFLRKLLFLPRYRTILPSYDEIGTSN